MKEERKWKTADGEEIPLSLMETTHIQNCIAFLEHKGFIAPSIHYFYLTCEGPTGEMAQDLFERECAEILKIPINPWLDFFEEELERRKHV